MQEKIQEVNEVKELLCQLMELKPWFEDELVFDSNQDYQTSNKDFENVAAFLDYINNFLKLFDTGAKIPQGMMGRYADEAKQARPRIEHTLKKYSEIKIKDEKWRSTSTGIASQLFIKHATIKFKFLRTWKTPKQICIKPLYFNAILAGILGSQYSKPEDIPLSYALIKSSEENWLNDSLDFFEITNRQELSDAFENFFNSLGASCDKPEEYYLDLESPLSIAIRAIGKLEIGDCVDLHAIGTEMRINGFPKRDLKLVFDEESAMEQTKFDLLTLDTLEDDNVKRLVNEIVYLKCAEARYNVLSEDKVKPTTVDLSHLLAAILGDANFLQALSKHFEIQPYQLIFPEEIHTLRTKLTEQVSVRTIDSGQEGNKNWYALMLGKYRSSVQVSETLLNLFVNNTKDGQPLNLEHFTESLVSLETPLISELKKLNKGHCRDFQSIIDTSSNFEKLLRQKVTGQDSALDELMQGYMSSVISNNQGPRLIFTFAGPSGVGKTHLAKEFAYLLNDIENTGYEFTIFNMEQYSDQRSASALFGSGRQYTDSALGELTDFVRNNPRTVLLFDEIEKAHENVVQSLLTVLDSGISEDNTSDEVVDFCQCIIIFTTNLGHEVFEHNPDKLTDDSVIFDVLRNAKSRRSNVTTALSPELVNRLSKGTGVLFSPLKNSDFYQLLNWTLNSEDNNSLNLAGPKLVIDESFYPVHLLSQLPELNARRISASASKLSLKVYRELMDVWPDIADGGSINDARIIDIRAPAFADFLKASAPTRTAKVLMVDDHNHVFESIQNSLSSISIDRIESAVGLKNAIAQKSPDLILLDLSISEGHQSSRIQNSLSIIKQLYEINPQLPVLLYSDSPAQRKNFRDAIKRALKLPNILDFFSIEDGHGKSLVDEIPEVLKKLELNHLIDQKTRENVSLSYSLHFEYCAEQQIITVEPEHVEFNIVMQGDDALQGLVGQKRVPDSCLADVIGLERAKHRLAQVIGWMREPQLLANYNVKLPTGFLLSGPPGTGKTLIAKAVAGECRLPFFAVNASDLTSTVVGGASEKIKNLFEQAHRYAPSLIFIDEIDAIAKQRNDSGTGVSNEQNAIVNTLLTCMDGFSQSTRPVLVMAATNHPELLDSAILRPGRFDENINCDLPNRKARTILFELFLDKFGLNPNEEEIKQLVDCSLGLSPAEIDRIAREAVYTAIETQRKVTFDDVRESAKNVMYGPKSSSMVLSGLEKRTTAYHEAGHLLAQKLLFPKQHIDYVTIEPRGNALGFVSSRQEEGKYSITKIEVQNKLIVLLAGREAELIIAQSEDEITTGASSDLEKATRIACDAIMRSGLDTTIGPISVVSLPRSIQDSISPNVMDQLATWLKTAQDKTRELLSVHRKTLDAIAQALIERESMEHDEIEALFLEI